MTKERIDEVKKILKDNDISLIEIMSILGNAVSVKNYSSPVKNSDLKTIDQWIQETLTSEQYSNAKLCKTGTDWNEKVETLSSALYNAFIWDGMPEGCVYWRDKYILIKNFENV